MTFGEMERAKDLAQQNRRKIYKSHSVSITAGRWIEQAIDDAVSIGAAIASGHDVELTDDGVRVIVREVTK
jgi:hypothetical protein